jgi:hypothetical protein
MFLPLSEPQVRDSDRPVCHLPEPPGKTFSTGLPIAELFGNISSAMAATGPLLPREDRSSYRSVGAVQNRPRFPLLLMAGQLEAVSRGRLELPIRAKRPDLSGRTRSLTMKQAWAIGGV